MRNSSFIFMFPFIIHVIFDCIKAFYGLVPQTLLKIILITFYLNFQGVCTALVSGIAMLLWFSFGGPRPVPTKLPLSVANCGMNSTVPVMTPTNSSEYFYPYRISYMWTSPVSIIFFISHRMLPLIAFNLVMSISP